MATYDYRCHNQQCRNTGQVFTVTDSVHTKKPAYPCPACGTESSSQVFGTVAFQWKMKSLSDARGVYNLERDVEQQYKMATNIADNAYTERAKLGSKEWEKSGGMERLAEELAEHNFKPDGSSPIVSTPSQPVAAPKLPDVPKLPPITENTPARSAVTFPTKSTKRVSS